jgi:hypothetical protein
MTPAGPPTVLTARSPEDLLAVVRVVLGFEPADSAVMLTVGARHPCHARIDLPDDHRDEAALTGLAEALLRPAAGHGARSAVLVLFTDDHRLARRVARSVSSRFASAGVDCVEAVRAHDGRWHPLSGRTSGSGATAVGVPYDVSAHPFVAAAVLEGRVIHGSRDELAATLASDRAAVALVEAARPAGTAADPGADAAWVSATVSAHVAAGTVPDPVQAARLLAAITVPEVRDAAWAGARRAEARRHVELWSGLVRQSPPDLLPHAAGVLAFMAWLAGDGALAWCGVDRAREEDPGHSLAGLVAELLEGVVPPDVWEQRTDRLGSAS